MLISLLNAPVNFIVSLDFFHLFEVFCFPFPRFLFGSFAFLGFPFISHFCHRVVLCIYSRSYVAWSDEICRGFPCKVFYFYSVPVHIIDICVLQTVLYKQKLFQSCFLFILIGNVFYQMVVIVVHQGLKYLTNLTQALHAWQVKKLNTVLNVCPAFLLLKCCQDWFSMHCLECNPQMINTVFAICRYELHLNSFRIILEQSLIEIRYLKSLSFQY